MPTIKRDGVNIYFESFGNGKPAIVFLHPWSTNRYIWANQVPAFAREHQCIVMDHRGHGMSDKPASGYAIGEMAADVVAVLDELGIDKAVLVGNSIGGMIAMQTNLDTPDRVIANLILSSGTNIGADTPPEVAQAMQQDWKGVFSGLLDSAIAEQSKQNKPEIATFMDGCFRCEDNFTEAVFFASLADPNGVFAWNITDRLGEISKPTLVIAGRQDGATTVEHNQLLADKIPNAEIKIYDHIAHFCQLEDPALFNENLTEFLKKVA